MPPEAAIERKPGLPSVKVVKMSSWRSVAPQVGSSARAKWLTTFTGWRTFYTGSDADKTPRLPPGALLSDACRYPASSTRSPAREIGLLQRRQLFGAMHRRMQALGGDHRQVFRSKKPSSRRIGWAMPPLAGAAPLPGGRRQRRRRRSAFARSREDRVRRRSLSLPQPVCWRAPVHADVAGCVAERGG